MSDVRKLAEELCEKVEAADPHIPEETYELAERLRRALPEILTREDVEPLLSAIEKWRGGIGLPTDEAAVLDEADALRARIQPEKACVHPASDQERFLVGDIYEIGCGACGRRFMPKQDEGAGSPNTGDGRRHDCASPGLKAPASPALSPEAEAFASRWLFPSGPLGDGSHATAFLSDLAALLESERER